LNIWRRTGRRWFEHLDAVVAAKVSAALYRIYIGQQADVVVVLLGGGTKKGQNRDILQAQERWARHKTGRR